MKKRLIIFLLVVSLLPGCSLLQKRALVDTTNSKMTKVKMHGSSKVTIKYTDGIVSEVLFDTTGRAGFIEQFFGSLLLKPPDITLDGD